MEFKKTKKYKDGRAQLTTPERTNVQSSTLPSLSHPVGKKSRDLPHFPRLEQFLHTKKGIVITMAIIGTVVTGSFVYQHTIINSSETASPHEIAANPAYRTVLPTGKSINDLGGWRRVSPDKNDPVYAYLDTIDGVQISVSQQPLPASFADNLNSQVAELARKFNATTKLDDGSTIVYVGTSAKGPQSTIFAKKNLLILIKSQKKIENKSWEKYADSLS